MIFGAPKFTLPRFQKKIKILVPPCGHARTCADPLSALHRGEVAGKVDDGRAPDLAAVVADQMDECS